MAIDAVKQISMEELIMEHKLYLLTGAAGFLGSNICAQLLERGDHVCVFVLFGDLVALFIPDVVD